MVQNLENNIEILAPAGNFESLKYAVAGGCNAVYLGLRDFSARSKAENFTLDELKDAVNYCHERGVKVYLALNVILKDSEIKKALQLVKTSAEYGIDAVIVQDLIFCFLVKKNVPNLPLHLSTQAGVHNYYGAKYAQRMGANRVVLSRETKYEDLQEILSLGIEVEVFAHGARCVSFSGNCYYSSVVSGYSGNRGKCLQLCRKKYKFVHGNNVLSSGYLLSPKDICNLGEVELMCKMGVKSLKIEGRLKNNEYAFITSRAYKNAKLGKSSELDLRDLKTAFNRGDFSTAYMPNSKVDTIYSKQQSNTGLLVGSIKSLSPLVISGYKYASGDAFKVLRNNKEVGSIVVQGKQVQLNGRIIVGDNVHMTKSGNVTSRAKNAIANFVPADIVLDKPVNAEIDKIENIMYELPEHCVVLKCDKMPNNDILKQCDLLIYSPDEYSEYNCKRFVDNINKKALLDMPIIAGKQDLVILKKIIALDIFDGYVVNNIYALELLRDKKIILGAGMNMLTETSYPKILSIESAVVNSTDLIYAFGRYSLMNFTHCAYKQAGGSCAKCDAKSRYLIDENNNKMIVARKKLANCYFAMLNSKITNLLPKLDCSKHTRILIDSIGVQDDIVSNVLKMKYNLLFDDKNHTYGRYGKGVK